MNRLQKKCAIASASFHLLLLLILFVGPAFLSSGNKADNLPVVDFIPAKLIDAPFAGGGNPDVKPPPAAPTPPAPAPPAPAPTVSTPPPPTPPPPTPLPRIEKTEPVKDIKPNPEALETKADNKTSKRQISTNLVIRTRDAKFIAKQAQQEQADAEAQALADARRNAVKQIGRAVSGLRGDLSSSTKIESLDSYGPGGGGETYASYAAFVKAKYDQAWIVPDDATSDSALVKVTVTIASDGTVISARVTQPSGDAKVDASVQRTLQRVTFIAPFPDGAKEKERTYIINFDLKAKKLG
jgi:colicin import membrane protein